MLKTILSIAGRPGLFRLVNRGKNQLIVESLTDGKRLPAHSRDKVISLGDISMYTEDGGEKPLGEVLESLKTVAGGAPVDIKGIADLREYFGEVMPEFDRERVYTSDIKKLLTWYNQLLAAGITDFKEAEEEAGEEAESGAAE